MSGCVTGIDRRQMTLFLDRLEDFAGVDRPVRAVDAFVDANVQPHGDEEARLTMDTSLTA